MRILTLLAMLTLGLVSPDMALAQSPPAGADAEFEAASKELYTLGGGKHRDRVFAQFMMFRTIIDRMALDCCELTAGEDNDNEDATWTISSE